MNKTSLTPADLFVLLDREYRRRRPLVTEFRALYTLKVPDGWETRR